MKVIILNGYGKVGKDKFSELCMKHHKNSINWSTVDEVKKILKNNFGWNGEKTNKSRKFLSELKRIWTEYNNGPFLDIVNKISKNQFKLNDYDKNDFIYFIHCREPQEIEKFVNEYKDNCITVLLKRENINIPDNDSDKNVNNFNYDYIIDNNGTIDDLDKLAIDFLNKIK